MARAPQIRPTGVRLLKPVGPLTQRQQFHVWNQQRRQQSAKTPVILAKPTNLTVTEV